MNKNKETVTLPKKSVDSLLSMLRGFAELEDELEDYLMLQDKELMKELKQARRDHIEGKVKDWAELKKKYDL